MQCFVINLNRAKERLDQIKKEFDNVGYSFTRIEAIDALAYPKNEIQKFRTPFEKRRYWIKEMSGGEIACFLSHRKAWEEFYLSGEEWGVFLEDDMHFIENPIPFFKTPSWIPTNSSIIQLATTNKNDYIYYRGDLTTIFNDFKLAQMFGTGTCGLGCQSYMLKRDVVKYLLNNSETVPSPVDDFLFHRLSPIRKKTIPIALCPGIATSHDNGMSYLQNDKAKIKTPITKNIIKYIDRKILKLSHSVACRFLYKKVYR